MASGRDVELEEANAEIDRLGEAVKELAVKFTLLEKERGAGLMPMAPVPARVGADTKQVLLDLLEHATAHGWPLVKAFAVLGLDVRRARRWVGRAQEEDGLADARPGASVNTLTPAEVEAIVSAFETYGEKDFSHRRLAHRGSYENLFWAAPSSARSASTRSDPADWGRVIGEITSGECLAVHTEHLADDDPRQGATPISTTPPLHGTLPRGAERPPCRVEMAGPTSR